MAHKNSFISLQILSAFLITVNLKIMIEKIEKEWTTCCQIEGDKKGMIVFCKTIVDKKKM